MFAVVREEEDDSEDDEAEDVMVTIRPGAFKAAPVMEEKPVSVEENISDIVTDPTEGVEDAYIPVEQQQQQQQESDSTSSVVVPVIVKKTVVCLSLSPSFSIIYDILLCSPIRCEDI